MAKSMRSNVKKAHRSAKRTREDSDYHIKDQARLARLNARLTSSAPADEATKDNRPEFADDLQDNEAKNEVEMDSEDKKKVSTSGRDLGRHRKRQQSKRGASFNGRKGGNRKK